MSAWVTKKQREALALMQEKCPGPNDGAYLTAEPTWADKWTPWVNFRTAQALERRGLVECFYEHEGSYCELTEAGRSRV